MSAKRYEEAEAHFKKYLRNRPNDVPGNIEMGAVQMHLGRWEASREHYSRTLPDTTGLLNLSLIAMYEGRMDYAEQGLLECIRRHPTAPLYHHDYSHFLMLNERWEEGWQEYAWRYLTDQSARIFDASTWWDGKPINGALLVHPEQGVGDTFHFLRYLQLCPQDTTLLAPERFYSLLSRCPYVRTLATKAKGYSHCTLLDLPRILHPRPLWNGSYLSAEPMDFGEGFKVGIAWKGNPTHAHDRFRSARAEDFSPLASFPGIKIVSLQVPAITTPFPSIAPAITTFYDTARAVAGCDLIVTVDTSVAHIAGAMGKPVWLMLGKIFDFRWGWGEDKTAWYPSARLFRQQTLCDWSGVMQQITHELSTLNLGVSPSG